MFVGGRKVGQVERKLFHFPEDCWRRFFVFARSGFHFVEHLLCQ